jgi:competence protein ComEA
MGRIGKIAVVAMVGWLAVAGAAAGAAEPGGKSPQARSASAEGRININQASKTELMKLDGVGARTAERIISYRETNGPFKRVEDLAKVQGVGKSVLEKNGDRLSVK